MSTPPAQTTHVNLTGLIKRIDDFPIGCGKLTLVFKAIRISSAEAVVIKTLRPRIAQADPGCICQAAMEVMKTLTTIQHTNLVPYLGHCNRADVCPEIAIIQPFYSNGTILEYTKEQALDVTVKTRLLRGVGAGLSHLHEHNLFHGDLHPGNYDSGFAAISDFGRTSQFGSGGYGTRYLIGDSQYTPPELILDVSALPNNAAATLTHKADVYCFALLTFELLTGNRPFPELSDYAVLQLIKKGDLPNRKLDRDDNINDALWNSLWSCWLPPPPDRPTIHQHSLLL
ncbi:kinase-like domain-containing protein [Flagelloscypha sp. PMI_526]|nr:kinase-like domain-containing protein [Flagelloscypha sp. PMI_526]